MLPFEWVELLRYGPSFITIKLFLLRLIQARTMRRADGMIFLTQYAKNGVESVIGKLFNSVVIAHGLNDRFLLEPGVQRSIELYTEDNPFRLLYVSIIDQYKHQWHVVEAVAQLRNRPARWNHPSVEASNDLQSHEQSPTRHRGQMVNNSARTL